MHDIETHHQEQRRAYYRKVVDAYEGPIIKSWVSTYCTRRLTHPEYLEMLIELKLAPPGTVEKEYPPPPAQDDVIDSIDKRLAQEDESDGDW